MSDETRHNPLAPLRVLVAASTHAGVTTRLKPKQARQLILASLSFCQTIRGFLALWRLLGCDRRRTHPGQNRHQKGSNWPKGSKSRDEVKSVLRQMAWKKQGSDELAQNAVLHHNTSSNMANNPRPGRIVVITPQSQVRKLVAPLEPRCSETSRPRGFIVRWQRGGAAYPRNRKGLRRYRPGWRLSPDDARDSVYSHAGPFHDPILAQTLGRLSVSRGLG